MGESEAADRLLGLVDRVDALARTVASYTTQPREASDDVTLELGRALAGLKSNAKKLATTLTLANTVVSVEDEDVKLLVYQLQAQNDKTVQLLDSLRLQQEKNSPKNSVASTEDEHLLADHLTRISDGLTALRAIIACNTTYRQDSNHPTPRHRTERRPESEEGETVEEIAAKCRVTTQDLYHANPVLFHFAPDEALPPGMLLRIPVADGSTAAAPERRDTIRGLAVTYGIAENDLRRLNANLEGYGSEEDLPAGTHVRLSDDTTPVERSSQHATPSERLPVVNDVAESIRDVATSYRVTVGELLALNPQVSHLDPDEPMPPGTTLRLPDGNYQRKQTYLSSDTEAPGESIADISMKLGISTKELREANPDLDKYKLDAPLPPGTRVRVPQTSQSKPPIIIERSEQQAETLRTITRLYGVSIKELRKENAELNQYATDDELPDGVSIALPQDESTAKPKSPTRGETLEEIAELYSVSIDALRAENPTLVDFPASQPLPEGTSISIPQAAAGATPSSKTIQQLCFEYNVTEEVLRHANPKLDGIEGNQPLPRGLVLQIPAPQEIAQKEDGTETLAQIAERYSISTKRIRKYNPHITADISDDTPLPKNLTLKIPQKRKARKRALQPDQETSDTQETTDTTETDRQTKTTTIRDVAKKYNVTEQVLRLNNPDIAAFPSDKPLPPNLTLRIPAAEEPDEAPTQTIREVAKKYNVTEQALRLNNPDIAAFPSDKPLPPNLTLRIPAAEEPDEAPTQTIREVAKKYNVTEQALRLNNPDIAAFPSDKPLPPNLTLRIPAAEEPDEAPTQTIRDVAKKYNVTEQVLRLNNPDIAAFPSDKPLPPNLTLRIPAEDAKKPDEAPTQTIREVAKKYNVTEQALRLNNPDIAAFPSDKPLPPSLTLRIPAAEEPDEAPTQTIREVAKKYNVTEQALRLNNPDIAAFPSDKPLPPNLTLRIPAEDAKKPDEAPTQTIRAVAKKYNVTEQALRLNNPDIAAFPSDKPLPPSSDPAHPR